MLRIILGIIYFLIVSIVAYLLYKGKNFDGVSWKRAAALSIRFIICALLLLWINYKNTSFLLNLITISTFLSITILWFLFSKIIRLYGTYPTVFLNEPKNNMRFIVRFEIPSMTIKYFEILFQQVTFLYLLFVVLGNLESSAKIFAFTLIVAIFHLGNFLFMHHKWVLFYFVLSIPMAIIFGYMISQGFVLLTTSLHLAFYLVFNARYWFSEKRVRR